METLFFDKPEVIRKEKAEMERQLKVKIDISGRKITLDGDPVSEYEATIVLDALSLGFTAKQALLLKSEDMIFRRIQIRDFTRRKNLKDVRARLIGSEGKTRRTIEEIADCYVVIGESSVGIIAPAESIDDAVQAVVSIIKGSKQANAYRYLERMNAEKKKDEGLGLKIKK